MAERTPLLKHPLVVLLDPFCPGFSELPGNFLFDVTPGTDGNVSLQAVSWMLSITFGIASLVVAFYRRHWNGLSLLSTSITRHKISGNQLWSGQKSVTMIRSTPHLTSLPRTSWMMFGSGKAYLRPFGHLSFEASPPDVLLSERSRLKYWYTICKQQTDWLLECLSIWITCGWLDLLSSTPLLSCPWVGHLPRDLPHLWCNPGIPLPHSCNIWTGPS